MNNSSIDQADNIDLAIKLNKQIADRIINLKRKCYDLKVVGPIELSQRSNRSHIQKFNHAFINTVPKFDSRQQELIINELSCRLNVQGLTIEQFLISRIDITQQELITILINKLKYPNQYSARRTARLVFEFTTYDDEEKRQIEDILFQFKNKLECSSYSRSTGKELFEKTADKIKSTFYHKIMNKNVLGYHMMNELLFSQGLDVYEIHQLLSYVLQYSPSSSFHLIQLKQILFKQEQCNKNGCYEKKQSILTKCSDDREIFGFGQKQQISFQDCEIQIIQEHEHHKCGIYDCKY